MTWENPQGSGVRGVEERIHLMKGTTTVGVKFKDGVVVASDKRATSGTFVASKSAVKTFKLTDYAVATISGLVADGQYLVNNLAALADLYSMDTGRPITVRGLARLLVLMLRRYRPFFLLAQLIVGGVDREGPHLFNVDLYGTMTEEDYLATGSGSPVAISVIEGGYSPEMDREAAIRLVISSMVAALSRDAATGDGIDVVVVDGGGVRFLGRDEISRMIEELRR
ncbi:MAG: proteasome subunit beta [Candidatus Korarchaeota archaeon NZ13-K]|nr:MAG: proteasome subunit beta [Candidatus Korarchaeota archaeon NZ13-K]